MGKWDEEFQKVLTETVAKKGTSQTTKSIPSAAKNAMGISSGSSNRGSSNSIGSFESHMRNKANVLTGLGNKYTPNLVNVSSRLTNRMTVGKEKKDEDKQEDHPVKDKIDSRLTVDNKKDEEEDKDKKWYQKGHFEDGWDFGDLTKTILGIDEDTASLKDLTINSAKRGYYNSLYGEETFKEIFGEQNQSEVYKKELEKDEYQFAPGNDLASGISGAFELIGQMARQYTNPRTLAMTGGAAGLAFAAGQAGPQVALPEEVLTVPSAALYGFKTGSALSNLEIEAGHAYNEMIEMGVKEDIAKKIALGVGSGNAALEFAQLGKLEDAFKTTAKKEGTEAVWKLMLKELQNRGVDVFTETAQEVGQDLVTIGGVQAANYLDKGEFAYSLNEVGNRLWDTTKSSALTFGMMNVPATAKNTYSIIKDNKNVPVNQTVQNEHPIEEQIPKVEQEIKPEVEEVKSGVDEAMPVVEQTEVKPPEKKVLYTGSANTDIKQFKVGGVDGSKQTGDRYGRGVYLTTNESTAKNYAGDNGRVYQINADDLNIFDLNDTITPEMRDSLVSAFNGGDKQFRNSMLRNFRTEMTFDDFESAEAFFDHQRKVWKEQDGEYTANKPEILEADNKTGRAVIEFTDFENWENNIGTLTGNHLYDALKSLSTDDFSSFITGHGFDGIAFDEDSDNQQYVIYRNEDRLHIDEPVSENETTTPTASDSENVAPVGNPVEVGADNSELATPAPTFPERAELDVLKDERKVLEDTLMSMVTVQETGEKFQELSKKWSEVNRKIEAIENNLTDGEGSTGEIAPTEARTDAPYFVSEDVASIVDKMVTQDAEAGEGTFAEPYAVYSVDDYVIQRRISRDGQKYSYTIITPDGAFRRGLVEQNAGAFYADVADKLTNLMMEAGEYSNEVDTVDVDESDYPNGVAATAPVRVVSTDKGDYLNTDNDFDEKGYSPINKIPGKQARILTETPKVNKKTDSTKTENANKSDSLNVDTSKKGKMSPIKVIEEYIIDNGFVFEKLSKKTKNRSLEAKWNFTRYSRGMAQHLIAHGSKADNVQSLKSIADKVEKAGLTQDFYNYLGHYRNIDGMTLDVRYNTTNKGVFGNDVTAAMSQTIVDRLEKQHPEFKEWAEEVYAYNNYLLDMSVDGGLITQELADRLRDMYPHFVPISRVGMENEIKSDNDDHVGVNSPVKHATGGNQDILPFFDTMASRTLATFNAVNMNDFGVELFGTLYPGRSTKNTSLDPTRSNVGMMVEDLDSLFDPQTELLQFGENGKNPTFSVFMDGERHTFDISHEMYEAMKPASDALSYKVPVLSQVSNLRRQLITEYNPWFMLKNAIKDTQDVFINSQHAMKTYGEMLFEAPMEMFTQGQWYQEYMANGGDQNTYFDKDNISLKGDKKVVDTIKKFSGLEAISKANNFVETLPRLAEYIASRKSGRSIQVSMLDAARVTTNFAAGGKATKFLNRNGATFLNASVQGTTQFFRNFAEAKQNGLKGWVSLATRFTAAGFAPVILNHLMWDDDEDYEKLPDYITKNYYVIAKYGDGQFLRLPKGRVAAVLQEAVEQLDNATAENGEVAWDSLYDIFMENVAPNNPATDNVFAPIGQVINGETWYGEDMIPYRLKDLPTTEQFDEKTSDVSIWLSEQLQDIPMTKWMELSPKEIHYLIDQYSGILGDTFLPMDTPKAESPIDNKAMKLLAPLRDIFTTDSVLNDRVTGDFYDTLEAAEAKAESEDATPEDKFESGMLIGYNAEISKLMQEQRDIQTSNLPDSEKYKSNRELKEKINALQEKGLEALKDYQIDGVYAEAGDKRYNYDPEDDTWWEIKPKLADGKDNYYYQQEQRITKDLGISYKEYWNNREMYDDFYYVAGGYDKDSSADDTIETARAVFGYERFAEIANGLKEIKADKDKNGDSISGTKYPKVQAYVNSLDIPDIEKKILYTMQYPNYKKYKKEIVKYLDANDDISYKEYYKILDELGYKVDSKGYVTW